MFVGPALAGVLFAVASTGLVFTTTALLVVVSALLLLLIETSSAPNAPRRELEASTIMAERLAGFTTLGRDRALLLMMVLLTAQTAIFGAVQVFIVVTALDLLDLGDGGVGYLNAAIGIGAFVGAVGALSLTGARRLSPAFLLGIVLIGVPLIAMGSGRRSPVAVVALALMGIGSSLVDVAGLTLVQRAVPDDVLARVFGVIQMLWMASIGIGAALVPVLISWLGDRGGASSLSALCYPILVLLLGRQVARVDAEAARAKGRGTPNSRDRPDLRTAPRRLARASRGAPRPSARRAGHRHRSRGRRRRPLLHRRRGRASRSRRTERRSPSLLPVATSARSRYCATSREPRPSRPGRTSSSTPSTAMTS